MRIVLSIVLVLLLAAPAQATTFASPSGSDSAAGTLTEPVQSLQKALALASDGSVRALPGDYPAQTIQGRSGALVTGPGAVLHGLTINSSDHLTLEDFDMVGSVRIQTITGHRGPNDNIAIERNRFTNAAVQILNNESNIIVRGNTFTKGTVGIAGPGRVDASYTSSHITIERNIFDSTRDGIQFGFWDDVTIKDNVFYSLHDERSETNPPECHPAGTQDSTTPECQHDDAVQFTGTTTGALVENNVVDGSASQGFLIQAMSGPISNVIVRRNVLQGISNAPVAIQGVDNSMVENNSVFTNNPTKFPGIWFQSSVAGRRDTNGFAQYNTGCRIKIDSGNQAIVDSNITTC